MTIKDQVNGDFLSSNCQSVKWGFHRISNLSLHHFINHLSKRTKHRGYCRELWNQLLFFIIIVRCLDCRESFQWSFPPAQPSFEFHANVNSCLYNKRYTATKIDSDIFLLYKLNTRSVFLETSFQQIREIGIGRQQKEGKQAQSVLYVLCLIYRFLPFIGT